MKIKDLSLLFVLGMLTLCYVLVRLFSYIVLENILGNKLVHQALVFLVIVAFCIVFAKYLVAFVGI